MFFRRIASNLRVTSGSGGTLAEYMLDGRPGGHTVKRINYQVVIRQKSSDNVKVGVRLYHGPDGKNFLLQSTPIASTTVGAGVVLLNGDSDATKMIGEYTAAAPTCEGAGNQEWANIDIYEIQSPL
ncbi:MAG: hypothetical protein LDL44_17820 [Caenispirillum sp.]|nr:hypothetical protein [Caenispirillum sp.]